MSSPAVLVTSETLPPGTCTVCRDERQKNSQSGPEQYQDAGQQRDQMREKSCNSSNKSRSPSESLKDDNDDDIT
ncbi:hypothetical protein E2C01_031451 [Portunus trituberculatus]|uniref:Uncharacterized protein n=1 Tax=Portunus trituberculatus TaxID=210409 RepID=A0A5B7EWV4_PORTR|nr:hypothetical protein [Portunus trituberculatus]